MPDPGTPRAGARGGRSHSVCLRQAPPDPPSDRSTGPTGRRRAATLGIAGEERAGRAARPATIPGSRSGSSKAGADHGSRIHRLHQRPPSEHGRRDDRVDGRDTGATESHPATLQPPHGFSVGPAMDGKRTHEGNNGERAQGKMQPGARGEPNRHAATGAASARGERATDVPVTAANLIDTRPQGATSAHREGAADGTEIPTTTGSPALFGRGPGRTSKGGRRLPASHPDHFRPGRRRRITVPSRHPPWGGRGPRPWASLADARPTWGEAEVTCPIRATLTRRTT